MTGGIDRNGPDGDDCCDSPERRNCVCASNQNTDLEGDKNKGSLELLQKFRDFFEEGCVFDLEMLVYQASMDIRILHEPLSQ